MPEYTERFFRSGTLRIHFRDWGDVTAPPLIIVHGLRDHSHSFDDLARGLLDRFHVFALDLRGHGDSETTPYYSFGRVIGADRLSHIAYRPPSFARTIRDMR